MTLKPKLPLALAAVVTVAGGYMLWRTWDEAACPNQDEVVEALVEKGYAAGEWLPLLAGSWPEGLVLRVGDWQVFRGPATDTHERVVVSPVALPVLGSPADTPATVANALVARTIVARPASAMARFRVRVEEYLFGHRNFEDPPPPPDRRSGGRSRR